MTRSSVCLLLVSVGTATADVQTLLTNYPDISSSNVTGYSIKWRPNSTAAFDRPALSPDGSYWLARGNSEDANTLTDTFLVYGSGTTYGIVARENDPIPTTGSSGLLTGEQFGNFNPRRAINNAGQFAFSTPGRNTPSSQNYVVVRGQLVGSSAANFTAMAREAQTLTVPGYGYNVGQFADGVAIDANGRVMWISQRTPGFPVLDPREGIFIGNGTGNTLVAQTIDSNLSVPANQPVTGGAPWRSFSIQFGLDDAGANTLVLGYLGIGNYNTLALNNSVILQQDAPLPDDASLIVQSIAPGSVGITPGTAGPSKWYCRGGFGGGSFSGSFGQVGGRTVAYAAPSGTIVSCGTERWSSRGGSLGNVAANDRGDFVVAGGTDDMTRAPGDEEGIDIPGYIRDEVLVANNRVVLIREGDPLDLDNNPSTNEHCVITDISTDTAVLTNDVWCYVVVATSRQAAIPADPAILGSALIRVRVPHFCLADVGSQGGARGSDSLFDNNDFVVFIDLFFSQSECADVGVQGGVQGRDNAWDNNDFVVFIDQFFTACN